MKIGCLLMVLGLCLCGCGAQETMETVADVWVQETMEPPRQIAVRLPDEAVTPVLQSDSEQVYLCEDYQLILETCPAGDLDATVQKLTGFPKRALTVMQTCRDGIERYDFVWTTAEEQGQMLGRAAILDDGKYHYCLSVLRSADDTRKTQIVWRDVFESFTLK